MLKDEIEQRFVRALLAAGVTHQQLELFIENDKKEDLAMRLKPHIDLLAHEAKINLEHVA